MRCHCPAVSRVRARDTECVRRLASRPSDGLLPTVRIQRDRGRRASCARVSPMEQPDRYQPSLHHKPDHPRPDDRAGLGIRGLWCQRRRDVRSYTQALIIQMAQTAVCNRHHLVVQQLCRWLLLTSQACPHCSSEAHGLRTTRRPTSQSLTSPDRSFLGTMTMSGVPSCNRKVTKGHCATFVPHE